MTKEQEQVWRDFTKTAFAAEYQAALEQYHREPGYWNVVLDAERFCDIIPLPTGVKGMRDNNTGTYYRGGKAVLETRDRWIIDWNWFPLWGFLGRWLIRRQLRKGLAEVKTELRCADHAVCYYSVSGVYPIFPGLRLYNVYAKVCVASGVYVDAAGVRV